MQLHLLSAADLRALVDMPTAIDAVARAFAHLSRGRARAPLRTPLDVEGGVALFMPGWVAAGGTEPTAVERPAGPGPGGGAAGPPPGLE